MRYDVMVSGCDDDEVGMYLRNVGTKLKCDTTCHKTVTFTIAAGETSNLTYGLLINALYCLDFRHTAMNNTVTCRL